MKLENELRDSLTELVGIGIGKAAEVLNVMLDSHIVLSAPSVDLVSTEDLKAVFASARGGRLSAVEMRYDGSMTGAVELVFASGDAGRLVDCLVGGSYVCEEGLDAVRAGTLCEIGNIVINAIIGTLANVLDLDLSYTVPSYIEGDADRLIAQVSEGVEVAVLLAETEFTVEDLSISGKIAIFFSLVAFDRLRSAIAEYASPST